MTFTDTRHRRMHTCGQCERRFSRRSPSEEFCSLLCVRRQQYGVAVAGCLACERGKAVGCDLHQVPPVCVCDLPAPDSNDECSSCKRPYAPVYLLLREAWRTHLQGAA